MASRSEARGQLPRVEVVDPVTISEQAAERALRRAILKSIAVSVVVMVAFWVLLVAVVLESARGSLR
jgi:hypothetical protein